MMLFFVALATIFFLKAMKPGSLIHWVLFGIFSALAFWSHFYAFVMIAALVLFALIEWAPQIRTELKNFEMLVLGCCCFRGSVASLDYRHPPLFVTPDRLGTHVWDSGAGDNPRNIQPNLRV